MYLICHVTLNDHMIKGLCKFMNESSSQHVTTLTGLVTIGIALVWFDVSLSHHPT